MGQGRAGGPRGPGGDKKASLGVTCCSPPGAVWVLENSPDQAVFDHYPQAPPIVWPSVGVKGAGIFSLCPVMGGNGPKRSWEFWVFGIVKGSGLGFRV